jgi:hypothetical protein
MPELVKEIDREFFYKDRKSSKKGIYSRSIKCEHLGEGGTQMFAILL